MDSETVKGEGAGEIPVKRWADPHLTALHGLLGRVNIFEPKLRKIWCVDFI